MDQEFLLSLFCDGTENFVTPMEPMPGDLVQIRFRVKRHGADAVFFISGSERSPMQVRDSDALFDYFQTELRIGQSRICYYFEVQAGDKRCLYDRLGVSFEMQAKKPFILVPGFRTPDWAKGAVMYQIFPDRFCNGDPGNDVLDGEYLYIGRPVCRVKDWNKPPAADGTQEFYGGDLQGVLDKLDYLQELGAEVLYLNPIFVSPSNHKYDTQDYDAVDPHFGVIAAEEGELLPDGAADNREAARYISRVTDKRNLEASNAFFANLVSEIHRRGMRVILDGVFNHCGSFHKWMDHERIYEGRRGYEPGAYVAKDSPYHSFFSFADKEGWPYNESFAGWWDYDTLPKLNYESSGELEQYILRIGAKWVSPPYNADGWRLDVAADLGFSAEYNHSFWRKFRSAVKEANPEAIILAEHYGDPSEWLGGDQWDTVMNYDAFMEPLTWFFTGEDKHSDLYREDMHGNSEAFQNSMRQAMTAFLTPSLQTAMNELSNHDHSRFLTRTSSRPGRLATHGSAAAGEGIHPEIMREAVIMQMTWPGAPTLYYADEAGVCGFTDPDSRRTYPWGNEDRQMLCFYQRAIALHRHYPVLTHGSLCFLPVRERQEAFSAQACVKNCLGYARFSRKSRMVVLFNNSDDSRELAVSVRSAGISDDQALLCIFRTDSTGFSEKETAYPVREGELMIVLPAVSAMVLEARSLSAD